MPSSPHPHRAPAHQLQHPEHASYSPSPRSTPLYSSTARSSQLYRTTSNASSPETFGELDPTRKGVSGDYLASSSSSRAPSTSRVSSAVYDTAPPSGPSPSKRRKASYDSPTVQSSARSSKTAAIETPPTDANAADSKASTRVAKACQPCSTKKRRCDGRQPECSVCQVLGTPCTYNHTGLKRGPPKGFRSGPKESARAKLVRTLETTIRDLVNHLGKQDAGAEIVRVAGERELHVAEASSSANAAHGDGARKRVDRNASSRIKIEHLTSNDTSSRFNTPHGDSDAEADDPAAEAEEDVIGETRQGELVYRGSSSGIGILQRQHRADSPAPGVGVAASRSVASSSSAPFAARSRETRGTGDAAVHSKTPVFLPISSPRPIGDNETVSSHDRSPRLSKTTPRRDAHKLYPGSSRDGPSAASHVSAEDPIVSDEENDRLFRYYWQGFHPFYPILYKPWFAGFSRQELRSSLEPSLLFAIYAIAACVVPGSASQSSTAQQPELSEHKLNLERAQLFCQAAESHVLANGLRPDIASIQTCWLLSLYSHGTGDLSRAWNFQNLASSMAVDMGLHRWPIYRPEIVQDRVQRETRIRVIWHCYIIDKLLCAEMGRPVGLRAKDIDVPLLSETEDDEFELWSDQTEMQSATAEQAGARPAGGSASSAPARRLHAPSCLNWGVHLFKIVERILDEVHSLRRKALLRRQGKEQVLADLDRQLTDWKQKLPAHLHLDNSSSTNDGPFPSFFALNLWYYTARLLLHRPFIPQEEGLTASKVLENDSHRQSTLAANTICDLLEASSRDIVDRLSTDLGYCLFTAAVMFVFNARLPEGQVAADARRRYGLCMQWLKKLADTWPAASAHRLLLDGFAVVGEDASKQGGSEKERRRPSIAASTKVSSWIAETEGALQAVPAQQQGSTATMQMPSAQDGSVPTLSMHPLAAGQWGKGDAGVFGGGSATDAGNNAMRSMGAIDFAPGIFDVESFFWNENAAAPAYMNWGQQLNSSGGGVPAAGVPQQQGFAGQPAMAYASFNGVLGGAGAGRGTGFQMQAAPAPTAMAYPVSAGGSGGGGFGQHERNTSGTVDGAQSMQAPLQQPDVGSNDMQQGAAATQGVDGAVSAQAAGNAPAAPFNTSPFAFNPSNQSIGEFWSMLELPPAFTAAVEATQRALS